MYNYEDNVITLVNNFRPFEVTKRELGVCVGRFRKKTCLEILSHLLGLLFSRVPLLNRATYFNVSSTADSPLQYYADTRKDKISYLHMNGMVG